MTRQACVSASVRPMVGLESPWHIAILALVVLLIFGSKRLPE
jgi:mttA/Hcf106 family protein